VEIRNGSSAAAAAHDPCRRLRSQLALIVARGGLRPDEPAVRHAGIDWDYATLVDNAQRIATGLVASGVQPDAIVALSAERTPLGLAAILAVLQVGAAYLPLDTGYPPARLAMMLQDARPDLLLSADDTLAATAPQIPRRTLAQLMAQQARPPLLGDGALAYVLFTSGSTGRPKGVAMTRRCVGALIDWHRHHPRLGLPARTLQFAPLAFDVSFQEILSTFAVGGTLVLPSDDERRDPHALLALIRNERIERLFLPYVALQALAEAALQEGEAPDSLRDVITAGEALRITPAIRALFTAVPQAVLHNHYGPTEAHVVSAHELAGDPRAWPELPPIGRALPHVQMRVVDADGNALAASVEGELLLGGDCLAAGYVHRADLTAQRFVILDGQRWYRTGDRVREGADGAFDYLGRCDEQIKLDGYRIEPAEIEAVLCRHSAVAEAAVVAVGGDADRRLVAHVVPRRMPAADEALIAELRAHCGAELAPYLVPQRFAVTAALPLTSSGKIDRRELARAAAAPAPQWPADAPLPRQLDALWRQLLGLDVIDADSNLFDLGARSITVVRALTELRQHGFRTLTAAQIYEHPSIARLAAWLAGDAPPPVADAALRGERQRAALTRFGPRTESSL